MVPKGTPAAIVDRLNAEVVKIVSNPEMVRAWKAQGATPLTMNVADFTRSMNEDIDKWSRIVKISGAKADQ